jgi:hypothetical protein
MIDINKLALEAYPEKLVTVGDNPELWDENEQYRECWIEGYNKALLIPRVVVPKGTLPKCEHKHIIGGDGCFECADCGA